MAEPSAATPATLADVVTACEPARDAVLRALAPWERSVLHSTCVSVRDAVPAAACAPSVEAMARRGVLPWLLRYDAPTPPHVLTPLDVRRAIDADNVDALRWMRACGLSLRLDQCMPMGELSLWSSSEHEDRELRAASRRQREMEEATAYAASRGSERALRYLCETHGRTPGLSELAAAVYGRGAALAERLAGDAPFPDAGQLLRKAVRCGDRAVVRAILGQLSPTDGAKAALRDGCGAAFEELHGRRVRDYIPTTVGTMKPIGDADTARLRYAHWISTGKRARTPAQRSDSRWTNWAVQCACMATTPRATAELLAWIDRTWDSYVLAAFIRPDGSLRGHVACAVYQDNATALRWLRERLRADPMRLGVLKRYPYHACPCGASCAAATCYFHGWTRFDGGRDLHAAGGAIREVLRDARPPTVAELCSVAQDGSVVEIAAMLDYGFAPTGNDDSDGDGDGDDDDDHRRLLLDTAELLARSHRFDALRLLTRWVLPAQGGARSFKTCPKSVSGAAALLELGYGMPVSGQAFVATIDAVRDGDREWTETARRLSVQYAHLFRP